MNLNLSNDQVNYLKSLGFISNDKFSGFYHIENAVLIAYPDGSFKGEFYEYLLDDDGLQYNDYSKVYSKPKQSLQEFVEQNFI